MIAIDLSGHRGLVTGANSGLGRAIALNLAAAGVHVAVHVINDHISANAVVKQIQQAGGEGVAVYGDVSQPHQVEKMFTRKACVCSPSPQARSTHRSTPTCGVTRAACATSTRKSP